MLLHKTIEKNDVTTNVTRAAASSALKTPTRLWWPELSCQARWHSVLDIGEVEERM